MKVLFLDIDGVLNPFRTDSDGNITTKLDDDCVNRLCRIIHETNCVVVISSSWKASNHLMDVLEEVLFPKLPSGCVVGCTPTFIPQQNREVEISAYLSKNSDTIDNYVIVDDYDFELKSFLESGHIVITDALVGLSQKDADECIRISNS
jgi:hypothetical protein